MQIVSEVSVVNTSLSDYELPQYVAVPFHALIQQFLNGKLAVVIYYSFVL